MKNFISLALFLALAACGSSSPEPVEPVPEPEPLTETPPPIDEHAERPVLSVEECEAQGVVVGDPGDGRTHAPDYVCPDGSPPIGSVPSGIEGAVCCPG